MAPLVSAPYGAGLRRAPRLRHRRLRACSARGSAAALLERGAAVIVLRRDERPGSALVLDGTEAALHRRRTATCSTRS